MTQCPTQSHYSQPITAWNSFLSTMPWYSIHSITISIPVLALYSDCRLARCCAHYGTIFYSATRTQPVISLSCSLELFCFQHDTMKSHSRTLSRHWNNQLLPVLPGIFHWTTLSQHGSNQFLPHSADWYGGAGIMIQYLTFTFIRHWTKQLLFYTYGATWHGAVGTMTQYPNQSQYSNWANRFLP